MGDGGFFKVRYYIFILIVLKLIHYKGNNRIIYLINNILKNNYDLTVIILLL